MVPFLSTRLFYKYGRSASYVGWHQDGITERLEDGYAPAVWLGLTAATVEKTVVCEWCLDRIALASFKKTGNKPIDSSKNSLLDCRNCVTGEAVFAKYL
jgi:hypothetical protein